MNKLTFPLMILIGITAIVGKATGQESFIETVQMANKSLVTVKAARTAIGPIQARAAIDPKTGRILIARRAPLARFGSTGAGVIIHPEGMIVTNLHTVKYAKQVVVILHDGTVKSAKILHILPQNDLALLKIDPPYELLAITMADSNQVKLGDHVVSIGHSELLDRTISGGVVYRLGTTLTAQMEKAVEVIQVNMNMYKGDSGGPLLNRDGHLVGMIAAKYRSKDKATLAIPSNKIKKLILDYAK